MSDDWRAIEHEAREQALADLQAVEAQPLPRGHLVAWSECTTWGHTNGLSLVHRAGDPIQGEAATLCGEKIPAPVMRIALTWGLVDSLGRCRYCEDAYMQKGNAA